MDKKQKQLKAGLRQMAVVLLCFIGVAMFLGCSTYKDYKTLTNDEIDGYFIVKDRRSYQDDTGRFIFDDVLKVFSIRTGEVEYYDLYKLLGLNYNTYFLHPNGATTYSQTGEAISRIYFSPDRNFMAFRVYGTDSNGEEYSNASNRFKIVQLNLETGETRAVILPEYCEFLSMPDEKTWLCLDYALERSEGKVFYKLWDIDTGMSRTIYTIADITTPKSVPHNFTSFYDLQNRVLIFRDSYLNDGNEYFYFEDEEKLEINRYKSDWIISMYNSNVIIGIKEDKRNYSRRGRWYAYNLETREYRELPFKSSVIYPVSENLYFFKEFMKPFRNGLFLESTHFFKLGIYDSEKNQVVARWFDNRTSYDPYDPKFVPKINIADQYKIKPLNE